MEGNEDIRTQVNQESCINTTEETLKTDNSGYKPVE